MNIKPFLLEDYYAKYEFNTQYMLSSSDPESWSLSEILSMATEEERALWDNQRFGYTETKGSWELRSPIAKMLYPQLTAENILCFAGAEEGIFCALLTMCTSEDHVIVLTPCYQSLKEVPRITGCRLTAIDLKEENNWRIDISAIKSAIQSNTKIVVINFPHNPTGQVISADELSGLIQLLKKHNIWLFSDEVYRLLGPDGTEWAQPAAVLYEKALSLGVMSKAYGMPGLRIGWIACQDKELLEKIERTKHYTSLCSGGPSEILSIIALRNQDIILERNKNIVSYNLALLDQFFIKYASFFSWVRPSVGCIGFVKYHGRETTDELCQRLRAQAGILLLPGSVYEMGTHYFRIGFGRKNMPEALARLEDYLEKHGMLNDN